MEQLGMATGCGGYGRQLTAILQASSLAFLPMPLCCLPGVPFYLQALLVLGAPHVGNVLAPELEGGIAGLAVGATFAGGTQIHPCAGVVGNRACQDRVKLGDSQGNMHRCESWSDGSPRWSDGSPQLLEWPNSSGLSPHVLILELPLGPPVMASEGLLK